MQDSDFLHVRVGSGETGVMATTTIEPLMTTEKLSEDMRFNDGHRITIIIYSILMVVSTVGNTSVLVNILKRRRIMRRRRVMNNYMYMHLAIADLLVTFLMMPLEIGWNYTVTWTASDGLCRIMAFFRIFGLYLSSFVVVCISLDRYFAILRPITNVVNEARRGKIMLSVAWLLATICSIPQVVIFHVESHPEVTWYIQCVSFNMFPSEFQELVYRLSGMILLYGLPLLIIIISYGSILAEIFRRYQLSSDDNFRRSSFVFLNRARNKTLKMAITISVVFFICWTPFYVMCLWYWIDRPSALKVDQRVQKGLFIFASTNSCMNPIVYGYFNFCSERGSGHSASNGRGGLQHHQIAALSTCAAGANSRRGSSSSSIYRNNSNQSMSCKTNRLSHLLARNNSREMDQFHPSPRNNVQTTSCSTTHNSRDENHLHLNNNSHSRTPTVTENAADTNQHTTVTSPVCR